MVLALPLLFSLSLHHYFYQCHHQNGHHYQLHRYNYYYYYYHYNYYYYSYSHTYYYYYYCSGAGAVIAKWRGRDSTEAATLVNDNSYRIKKQERESERDASWHSGQSLVPRKTRGTRNFPINCITDSDAINSRTGMLVMLIFWVRKWREGHESGSGGPR